MIYKVLIPMIIFLSALGYFASVHFAKDNANSDIILERPDISYSDKISGEVKQVEIIYESKNPFKQVQYQINKEQNEINKNKRDNDFSYENYNVIFNLHQTEQDVFTINMDLRKNIISIAGLTPQTKISLYKNDNVVVQNIASDWTGRISFDYPDSFSHNLQSLCLKVEDVNLCHSPIQKTTGVRS